MNKQKIMEIVNDIIEELWWYNDEEFIDRVISAISNGEQFTDEEIENEVL